MSRPTWNKDKTELTYKDGSRWLKETYNKDFNLIKRTTSWGEWTEHEINTNACVHVDFILWAYHLYD